MKTSERRELADRAMNQVDKLEMEIRAQMNQHQIQGELDESYADFKAYSKLRDLHQQYAEWKQQYAKHADNVDLVNLVGQSEHDILRENYPRVTSETAIVTIPTVELKHFYERDTGTPDGDKIRYQVDFEKIKILPFHTCYHADLNSLFVRVNLAGMPH